MLRSSGQVSSTRPVYGGTMVKKRNLELKYHLRLFFLSRQ